MNSLLINENENEFHYFFPPNSQVQLLELGLSTASAHVGTAANNTNEQKVAENKI